MLGLEKSPESKRRKNDNNLQFKHGLNDFERTVSFFSDTLESDSSHSDDDIEICEKIDARIIKYDPSREK